jgi:type I restriction enzyme M protein
MATANNNNTASIGFEQQIWVAADILRGNMDAAEYKHVVLGLIFLKYISDKFEERYHELETDNDDVEDKDAYAEVNVFFVPPSAHWRVICEAAHKEEIGTVIDEAMRAIEKEDKWLRDILPKNYARGELDKRHHGNVVDLFTIGVTRDIGNSYVARHRQHLEGKFKPDQELGVPGNAV